MKKRIDNKPWGREEIFVVNKKVSVKIINVDKRKRLSLQKHKYRNEFWRFLDNDVKVTLGNKIIKARKGDELFIKKGTLHRIEGLSKDANILEISFGNFNENDIERIEDDFGRVK